MKVVLSLWRLSALLLAGWFARQLEARGLHVGVLLCIASSLLCSLPLTVEYNTP